MPQDPRLWPHLNERCRPGGKHVPVVVHPVVLRACRPGGRSHLARGVVHLALLPPGPCHRRSPWSRMVRKLGKGHCDAQAFVAKELPESSLPPPSSGSRSVSCHLSSCPHEGTKGSPEQNACNLHETFVVVVVAVFVLSFR